MRDVGTKTAGHFSEDADDLTALLTLQLTDMVVGLNQLDGLDIDRLPRR